ncbi:hypothetical protein BS47DRAFT_1168693 [Hydnum rufescens UP504]|uniref:Uncharacterized protein n=1 Tax=Hydnum rufescens UP504 TaxID=1448309 RepID=A0A9P6DRX2_9AGAM|nr:hypothetical protein BS47DRAFT_1168693 [Hydnum rufescens UP504]
MFFNLATLILPVMFLGGITTATPLETREVKRTEVPRDVSNLKSPVPVSPTLATDLQHTDLEKGAPLPGGLTTPANSTFHTLADTVDQFFTCSTIDCGSCTGYALSSIFLDTCYSTDVPFVSSYIYQASNAGLPYYIYIAFPSCTDSEYIPAVNECFYNPYPDGSPQFLWSFYSH